MPAFSDLPRDEDLVIVGAGMSGLDMAHHVQRTTAKTFIILEARHELGGTWSQHTYPGIRSDSDMFSYGMSWLPWNKPRSIATGPEILDHLRQAAAAEHLENSIYLHCQLRHADWDSASCRWHLTVADAAHPDEPSRTVRAQYLYFATGFYDYEKPHRPQLPGMNKYQRTVVHPQYWPAELNYSNKKVVIIGSGSTAVTLLPSMVGDAEHITIIQRSPGYFMALPRNPPESRLMYHVLPMRWAWWCSKWLNTVLTYAFIALSLGCPSFTRCLLRWLTKRALPPNVPLDPHFNPTYKPWEQRMCIVPDGDFFSALRTGKASMVTGAITDFTSDSIVVDGREIPADVVVTATGFNILLLGGATVSADGEEVHVPDKLMYQGTLVSDLPNVGVSVGYGLATWTLATNLSARYMCRIMHTVDEKRMDGFVVREALPSASNRRTTPATGHRLPILPIKSGFIQRAAHLFPSAGSRGPWRPRHLIFTDSWSALVCPIGKEVQFFASKNKSI